MRKLFSIGTYRYIPHNWYLRCLGITNLLCCVHTYNFIFVFQTHIILSVECSVPCIFGVLTCDDMEQLVVSPEIKALKQR
ncbi:unnamed protein product [Coffea canephora]|uniref:Uncharacterized protein n=1 Tax=Coffea canephora TaxID=49390 RepID=A0A068VHU0_COFCA|nr:unnamed protein product [Coffea canephora]